MHRERFYTLSASCPDQVGIIAKVSGFIAGHGGWILESSYHADGLTQQYFMRIEIKADSLPFLLAEFRERFRTTIAVITNRGQTPIIGSPPEPQTPASAAGVFSCSDQWGQKINEVRLHWYLNCPAGSIFHMQVGHQCINTVEALEVASASLAHGGDDDFVRNQRIERQRLFTSNAEDQQGQTPLILSGLLRITN